MARGELKAKIAKLRMEQPHLSYSQIATIVGCPKGSVSRVCSYIGLGAKRGNKSMRDAYMQARKDHPDWSPLRISKHIGCCYTTAFRWEKRMNDHRDKFLDLGRAAARAGLTIKMIEEMANAR